MTHSIRKDLSGRMVHFPMMGLFFPSDTLVSLGPLGVHDTLISHGSLVERDTLDFGGSLKSNGTLMS